RAPRSRRSSRADGVPDGPGIGGVERQMLSSSLGCAADVASPGSSAGAVSMPLARLEHFFQRYIL
ncbi:hypothetical protein ACFQ07_13025, partial [Actinomadura adrarensis]